MQRFFLCLLLILTGCYHDHFPDKTADTTNPCDDSFSEISYSLKGIEDALYDNGATFQKKDSTFVFTDNRKSVKVPELLLRYVRVSGIVAEKFKAERGAGDILAKREAGLSRTDLIGENPQLWEKCQ